MKYLINQQIKSYLIRIMTVIMFVMLSIPVWMAFDNSSYASIAEEYDKFVKNSAKIAYVENTYNEISHTYYISFNLDNIEEKEYYLLLKIDNEIETNNIKINYQNQIRNIEEIRYTYSENYNYFLIDKGNLDNNKNYTLDIIIPSEITEFNYNFELIEK